MTDQHILSIDPGKSSGIALLTYNDSEVWLEGSWQFNGGAEALVEWIYQYQIDQGGSLFITKGVQRGAAWVYPGNVVCEAFTARSTQGFSYTTDSLEPLPAIGALVALGIVNRADKKRYRDPKLQYLVGGKDKADKKKRQHKFLKDSGFYVAPSALGTTDADDFRSACAHGLSYLQRELKHRGVHAMVSEWMEKN